MKRLLLGTALSALFGHLTGILSLLVLTGFALSLENPSGAALPMALIALALGAILTGLFSRKTGAGILSGLFSGFFFALIPLVISLFFGANASLGIGMRFVVALAVWVIAALFSVLGRKRGKKRAASPNARKKKMMQRAYRR